MSTLTSIYVNFLIEFTEKKSPSPLRAYPAKDECLKDARPSGFRWNT